MSGVVIGKTVSFHAPDEQVATKPRVQRVRMISGQR